MGGEKKRNRETDGIENDNRCNKRREGRLFQEAHQFLAGASTAESCTLWLQKLIDKYDSYDFSKQEMIMMNRVIEMVKAKVLCLFSALPVESSRV